MRHKEPYLAQGAVVVQASQASDVFRRDGGRVLLQYQRICVRWIGHHQYLRGLQMGMRMASECLRLQGISGVAGVMRCQHQHTNRMPKALLKRLL